MILYLSLEVESPKRIRRIYPLISIAKPSNIQHLTVALLGSAEADIPPFAKKGGDSHEEDIIYLSDLCAKISGSRAGNVYQIASALIELLSLVGK